MPGNATSQVLQFIAAPLGFYVLALLIVESSLALVVTVAELNDDQRWWGFLCMIGLFVVVVGIVTGLVVWAPKNLVFGKEEHASPQIHPSALRDQIEDLIVHNVKSDCLKRDSS
jgi:hypothetical protein